MSFSIPFNVSKMIQEYPTELKWLIQGLVYEIELGNVHIGKHK